MLRAKVVIVGDACVGKTAIVQMLKSGGHDYPKSYIMVRASFLAARSFNGNIRIVPGSSFYQSVPDIKLSTSTVSSTD